MNRYTCPYCDFSCKNQGGLTYHLTACIYDPEIRERVKEVIAQPDQTIMPRLKYAALSGEMGIPSSFHLTKICGSWSEVAKFFGLTGGKTTDIKPRQTVDIVDAFVEEERDRLYTRTMDFPLKSLPPKVKRLYDPMRHTNYHALVMELR
jgi:hypothetical protein